MPIARLIITEAAIRIGNALARVAAVMLARFLFCASLPVSGHRSRAAYAAAARTARHLSSRRLIQRSRRHALSRRSSIASDLASGPTSTIARHFARDLERVA